MKKNKEVSEALLSKALLKQLEHAIPEQVLLVRVITMAAMDALSEDGAHGNDGRAFFHDGRFEMFCDAIGLAVYGSRLVVGEWWAAKIGGVAEA